MSALGAIETPVAAADGRTAARPDVIGRQRPLRAVGGSTRTLTDMADRNAAATAQPRSSSIPRAASQGSPSLTGPVLTGPVLTGPVQTGPVLTGTVVSGRTPRFASAASVRVPRAPLRLTKRGRIAVAVLLVAVLSVAVLLVTMLASGRAQATNHGQPRAGYQGMHQVVVRPGQTLWSLAAAADPAADPRNVVQDIMSANALGSPSISAGQLLWVP